MEIKKETTQKIFTTNQKEIHIGDTVVFETEEGKAYVGTYEGIHRAALKFKAFVSGREFNVLPRTIVGIYMADVVLDTTDPNEKKEGVSE